MGGLQGKKNLADMDYAQYQNEGVPYCSLLLSNQIMPWLRVFPAESNFIRMGFHHSLIHLFTFSITCLFAQQHLQSVYYMLGTMLCPGDTKAEGTCVVLGVPGLGGAGLWPSESRVMASPDACCSHNLVTHYSQMRPFRV